MKPLSWSPSALDTFKNCPKQYHHKYVLKDLPPEEKSEQQDYGEWVHQEFQKRQDDPSYRLPVELAIHEDFMAKLQAKDGVHWCEQKIALTRKLEPVNWEWRREEIWFRGIMDYKKVAPPLATLIDYKTGKPHSKFAQLGMYAIHTFLAHEDVNLVNAQFYWTKDQTVTKKVWARSDMDELWNYVLADLNQYAQAFKQDVWQPRPSGLCNGWCPVKSCVHWKPKRT